MKISYAELQQMRERISVLESIVDRYAAGWKAFFPGMMAGAQWVHIACWGKEQHPGANYWITEDMSHDQLRLFEESRRKQREETGI